MRGLGRVPILRTFGSGGKPWARSDKITARIGVCSLALAVVTVVQTQANKPKESDLQVAVVSARLSEEIDATEEDPAGIALASNTIFTPRST